MITESKKCKACGHEMSIYSTKCGSCGAIEPRGRHLFITIWLWFCTVINVLMTVVYFILLFSSIGLWSSTPEPLALRLLWLAISIAVVAGYVMLLKWNKSGYYVLGGVAVVNVIISLLVNGPTVAAFTPVVGILVLYGILQIKKDGVEYWEAMEAEM